MIVTMLFRSFAQQSASAALMKLPSQTMAPLALHDALQLLKTEPEVVQLTLPMAWQLMSQLALAWAVQLPWQAALHSAEQLAMGGTTLQLVWHRAEQLALH